MSQGFRTQVDCIIQLLLCCTLQVYKPNSDGISMLTSTILHDMVKSFVAAQPTTIPTTKSHLRIMFTKATNYINGTGDIFHLRLSTCKQSRNDTLRVYLQQVLPPFIDAFIDACILLVKKSESRCVVLTNQVARPLFNDRFRSIFTSPECHTVEVIQETKKGTGEIVIGELYTKIQTEVSRIFKTFETTMENIHVKECKCRVCRASVHGS
jgi:hypothetical protein